MLRTTFQSILILQLVYGFLSNEDRGTFIVAFIHITLNNVYSYFVTCQYFGVVHRQQKTNSELRGNF